MSARALVIPVEGPVVEADLRDGDDSLTILQKLVGGYIEAIALPEFLAPDGRATAYINEEGKFIEGMGINRRATDLLVPGVGLFFNDYIAGPLVVCGFDPRTGRNLDVPEAIERRVRLIEEEAGT